MHGEIKLRQWLPFRAEQVIRRDGAMTWNAAVRVHGLSIHGFDRLVNGHGEMRWKIFGVIPVMSASGADIARSTAGRVAAESVWLPSLLSGDDVSWNAPDLSHTRADFAVNGHAAGPVLTIDGSGRLEAIKLLRWGNPDGAKFYEVDFGGVVEQEDTFCGFTIPTRLRIGWYFGTDRFEKEGEFFRVTIDDATYR